MGHSDEHMRGRMAEQTLELFTDDGHDGPGHYLEWEVDNHLGAYGVGVDMYPAYLNAIKEAVAQTLGADWQPTHEAAWTARIDTLLRHIEAHANDRSAIALTGNDS